MQIFFKSISKARIVLAVIGIVIAGAVGVSAYEVPQDAPNAKNSRDPIHIGIEDQIKDGGLSVNAFQSRGDARLEQNATFKGTVRGGLPTDATSTITSESDTDISGLLHAQEYLNSLAISHPGDTEAKPLCSDKNGVIGLCSVVGPEPSFVELSSIPNNTQSAPYTTQVFWIGSSIPKGAEYVLSLGNAFYINAVPGDTPHNIALKMVTSVNSKTEAQWREYWGYGGTPPATGTPGFPPRATMVGDSSFKVTAYPGHSFAASAASGSPWKGYCGDMVDGTLITCSKGYPAQVMFGADIIDLQYCDPNAATTTFIKPPNGSIVEGAELYSDQFLQSPQGGSYVREYPGSAIRSMNNNVVGPIVDYYSCY